MTGRHKFHVHCCVLDSECRGDIGWCWRLEIRTPWWHLGIALTPANRYVRLRDRNAAEPFDKANLKREWINFSRY